MKIEARMIDDSKKISPIKMYVICLGNATNLMKSRITNLGNVKKSKRNWDRLNRADDDSIFSFIHNVNESQTSKKAISCLHLAPPSIIKSHFFSPSFKDSRWWFTNSFFIYMKIDFTFWYEFHTWIFQYDICMCVHMVWNCMNVC